MTGARYLESMRDGRTVWIDGKKAEDITTDPAFKDMVHELARVYDLQTTTYRDEMTYVDEESGVRTSLSWLVPKSLEDSQRKRRNSELWNELTWGQLGRSPDILAPFIVGLMMRKEEFGTIKHPKCDFAENIANYYRHCRDHDLFLTHALGDPQVDRSSQPQNERRQTPEEDIALHVVEETNEGIIVSGGKQLSTAAVHSNETYVSLSQTFAQRNDPRFVLSFSIATNTPGLNILSREPIGRWFGSWGHPLQMLDEQDNMLFFDHVLVPWDRVFMLYESPRRLGVAVAGGQAVNFAGWANLTRAHYRMRLMTAVATMVAESIGVIEFREVAAKLGEMVTYCEMWRHAMNGLEHPDKPSSNPFPAAGMGVWMAQTSARMVELLREICGSGIIMQPSENDLANPELRPFLEQFMRGKDVDVEYKSRLFRFAHELGASSFGMRQDIYEYWHGGDPNRNRINLLRGYDQSDIIHRIKEVISKPLPHGEVP
jgi:4-hydroxyphenylacetate 3-monooxygenase oxygenase component